MSHLAASDILALTGIAACLEDLGQLESRDVVRRAGKQLLADEEQGSLRDRFAMAAMQGICASSPGGHMTDPMIAKEAYRLADAMLAARGVK